jgi:hypothetical protein
MDFKSWLLTENNIAFTVWASDGTIIANVNGVRYKYRVSAHLHPSLQKTAKYKPFTALNQIKEIDPDPVKL